MASPASYFNFNTATGAITGLTNDGKAASAIEIPSDIDGIKVVSLGNNAFYNCTNLTSVIIPNSITSINNNVFCNCTNLTNVVIGNGLTKIGGNVFTNTPWLANKQEKNKLVIVNNILIDGTTCIGKIAIPNSVTSISANAFYGNIDLISVTIPDSVTSIGSSVFSGCTNLTNVVIGNGLTVIPSMIFENCSNLTRVIIPNSITNIEYAAFNSCDNLATINYTGSEEQWNVINISSTSSNKALTNATKIYNCSHPIPPTMSGADEDIGVAKNNGVISYVYTVTVPNGGTVHIDEAVDGVIFNSFDTTSGSEHTLTLNVADI